LPIKSDLGESMDAGSWTALSAEQIQSVRFGGERVYAGALSALTPALNVGAGDGARIRRLLLARSLLLSEGMAPAPYTAARQCAATLGVTEPIEIYQAAGAENAAMHHCQSPVLLEIQGRLLSLLDDKTLAAVMGHELGHYLAHGVHHPHAAAAHTARRLLLNESTHDDGVLDQARRLSMAMELTADRFGLLACRDLDAALRLEMVVVTGLPASELTWDTQAYLEQSRSLIDSMLSDGETALGYSHPEHSLRAYALWLFSESDLYRQLTDDGPGTRPIAEVDEQLMRVLGHSEVEFGNATVFEEPQIEVQECALAACVLVAAADGEIHDAEVQAIERVFAHLLPDWRELLDPAEALARFQQLAPVLYATGPRAQRSLFALLTHVLAADGECAPEEIDQILAIGSALGCIGLFRSLLPSVLAASTLSVDIVTEEPVRSIPMPAEARQARAALKVYLDRVVRRGGDTVTVRRLMRLIGAPKNSEDVRRELESAAREAGLLIQPAIGDELDALLKLQLVAGPSAEVKQTPVQTEDPGSPAARLRRAITRMRDKLVSGDGRSPSIRLRVPRAGRAFDLHQLEDVSNGLAERALEFVTSGGSIVVLDGADADAHEGSHRALNSLVALDRERQSRTEETGADELYLGYPFLTGTVNGYLLRGPLVLYPAVIQRDRGRVRLVATANETPIANQALLRLLLRQKQIPFPETLVEECDAAAESGPKMVVEVLDRLGIKLVPTWGQLLPFKDRNQELNGWIDDRLEIEECAVLGLFPQSSSDLLHDYDELLTHLQEGKSPRSLFACAGEVLPAELKALLPAEPHAPVLDSVGSAPIPAIHADPVQRAVLEKARASRALVIDGPPGTGKSQVIVNLVADALLRGEKVAVVCEKRAALDVVVNRLEALDFRHLLALVHDVHEDRRSLYQQVAARIEEEIQRPRPSVSIEALHAQRLEIERDLSTFSERLRWSKSGVSLGQAYVYRSSFDVPAMPLDLGLEEIPAEAIEAFASTLQALAPFADLWRPDSVWLAPGDEPKRPNLDTLDSRQSAIYLEALQQAQRNRQSFEEACAAADMAPDAHSLVRIGAARIGIEAVLASAKLREAASDFRVFADLLGAVESSAEVFGSVESTLESMRSLEIILANAGLESTRDTHLLLRRSQMPLELARAALASASTPVARSALSAWCKNEDSSAITLQIQALAQAWQQHEVHVQGFSTPVDWSDTPQAIAAGSVLAATSSSPLRFFKPSWWKAKKQFTEHLAQQWPEKAGASPSADLFDQIDKRRSAAKGWVTIKSLAALISHSSMPADATEASLAVRQIVAACDQAALIAQAKTALQGLGLWPAPMLAVGWASWGQRVEACLAALPAIAEAEERYVGLRKLLPRSELAMSVPALEQVQRIAKGVVAIASERIALQAVRCWPESTQEVAAITAWDRRVSSLLAVLAASASLNAVLSPAQVLLPWLGAETSAAQWSSRVSAWRQHASRLAESDRLLLAAQAQHRSARGLLVQLAQSADVTPGQWTESVLKTWAAGVVAALDPVPDISLSELLEHDAESEHAERYRRHSGEATDKIASLVLAKQDENGWLRTPAAAKGARRTDVQATKEAMLKEARKQRALLPLRTFVRRYVGQGLLDALPVWLLSPETMVQLFPREACFDVVILDEASQCTVENGLPVLMRAKRVIIAGDERQMPPSNFFKATSDDEDSVEAQQAPQDVLDAESLLVLARSRVAHAGLAWHYRCQQEELIAFSNHAIYGGGLMTIPSVMSRKAPAAVFWHGVQNAHYEEGVNQTEAIAVVELLKRLMERLNPPTIGVVTFNLAQRKVILDAIDQVRAADTAFAALYDSQMARERIDERPFVKNLENVQGDERDIIVFSLGHAPRERVKRNGGKELYVPARFGPVGQRGGERRLNVAVSRAKKEIHVVASFDPSMLSVATSKNDGPRLFKGFLEFAKAMALGHRNEAERVLDLMRGAPLKRSAQLGLAELPMYVPLKAQLMLALEREGFRCELDVGASGFRVPLALVSTSDPHRYCLGLMFIEGDQAESPIEAHLHVPGVLNQRGWKLMRINARDWGRQPAEIVRRIKAAATA
jgi:hypothetical protein